MVTVGASSAFLAFCRRPHSNPVICGSKPYVTSCQVTFWTPLFGNPGADVLSLLGERTKECKISHPLVKFGK